MIGLFFRLLRRGVTDLLHSPWTQLLTLAAVTLSAFLGGLFLLVLHNLDDELLAAKGSLAFQVYWKPRADMDQVRGQWRDFDALPFLAQLQTYTPDEALAELAKGAGGGFVRSMKDLQGNNPLPATALLTFSRPQGDVRDFSKAMLSRLQALPGVADVHYNPLQMELAASWASFSARVIWPLIVFLGLVVALVVGNTIKLSMLSRRDEVEILQLVGAGRWYIRLPLLVGGAVQGFIGGMLSLAMLKGVQLALQDLFNTPPLHLQISFLPLVEASVVVAVMVVVGIFSSVVALRE